VQSSLTMGVPETDVAAVDDASNVEVDNLSLAEIYLLGDTSVESFIST
jgi:hypothetical protein